MTLYRTDAAEEAREPHLQAETGLDLGDVETDADDFDDADWLDGWRWELGPEPGRELARD